MALLIQASGVGYDHGGHEVFQDIDIEIHEGDRLALIGENGAGKSTLMRLLARQITPHAGEVTHRRNLVVGWLEQEPTAPAGATLIQAASGGGESELVQLEARMRQLEARMGTADPDEFDAVLEEYASCQEQHEALVQQSAGTGVEEALQGLGFGPERWEEPFAQLSGGEKKLVGLARLLASQADVLLLDEPDNHLDIDAKRWLEQLINQHRGAVALISHDRYFLDRVANRIVELEDGQAFVYHTNYSQYLPAKRERLEREAQLRAMQERELKELKRSAERLREWARMNPKFAKRAGNRWRMLDIKRQELASRPKPVLDRRSVDIRFDSDRGSQIVLNIEGAAKRYGEREVLAPFDLLIGHGERVGLIGENGAGKTTLFRMILSEERPDAGRIRLGPSIKAGYYSQEQETLDPSKTPLEIVRDVAPKSESQALGFLSTLLFDYQDATNLVGNLSGGQKARLQIAILMLQGANFLLLDEPTNNLDIPSCEELEAALDAFDGTILAISHDRYFLDRLATRIVELDEGRVREYPGNFSDYQRQSGRGRLLTVAGDNA